MRPQQQNRRMRGRNSGGGSNNNNNSNNNNGNNRKGPNTLNRNYESNGPDVKIRGSAQQIAEKYATLARDAQSSGDRVMAENYLQHAEHYNRIIAAAQAQMPIQNQQPRNEDFDDDLDDEREEFEGGVAMGDAPVPVANHGAGPQPVIEGMPAEVALNGDDGNGNGNGNGGNRHRDRRHNNGYGQNGQRGEFNRNGDYNRGEQSTQRDEAQAAPAESGPVETPAQFEGFNPAAIAAQAEQNESPPDGSPRRGRRPRRARDSGQQEATGEAAAEPDNVPVTTTES